MERINLRKLQEVVQEIYKGFGEYRISRGGRTGKKLHIQNSWSSCLKCGRWVRAVGVFNLKEHELNHSVPRDVFCEKCFEPELLDKAVEEEQS